MGKRCAVCGKILQDNKGIPMDDGKEMCEKCWNAFSNEDNDDEGEEQEYEEAGDSFSKIEVNGKEYVGSVTSKWTESLKKYCYIEWIGTVILFAVIGGGIFSLFDIAFAGVLLGGILGYSIGYGLILVTMIFVTMNENISIMTDNTARLLAALDKGIEK